MIRRIKGILAEVEQDQIIVDLHGLGLCLSVSAATRRRLPPPGEPVFLYTYLYVRDDDWQLYGFADREEERLFQTLLKINGVGPRLALSILSALSPEQFYQAVSAGDVARLTRIDGIGKKTAERLIFELRGRFSSDRFGSAPGGLGPGGTAGEGGAAADAVAALMALGYTQAEAEAAVRQAQAAVGDEDVQVLLKNALKVVNQ